MLKDISKPLNFEVSFDGILAQAVLLHTPKKEIVKVIKNVVSPLKAGGYFYVAVKESRVGQSDEQTLREGVYGSSYERFFSFFTQEEMEDYLKKIGLKIVYSKIIPKNQTNWVQIIAKK